MAASQFRTLFFAGVLTFAQSTSFGADSHGTITNLQEEPTTNSTVSTNAQEPGLNTANGTTTTTDPSEAQQKSMPLILAGLGVIGLGAVLLTGQQSGSSSGGGSGSNTNPMGYEPVQPTTPPSNNAAVNAIESATSGGTEAGADSGGTTAALESGTQQQQQQAPAAPAAPASPAAPAAPSPHDRTADKPTILANGGKDDQPTEETTPPANGGTCSKSAPYNNGSMPSLPIPLPNKGYRVSDCFGTAANVVAIRHHQHKGLDMAIGGGTPIKAVACGKILAAGWLDHGCGYGIKMDIGNGFAVVNCHMSKVKVKTGDSVGPGDVVGLVGHTGTATGNHLHFALKKNGTAVNPLDYMPQLADQAYANSARCSASGDASPSRKSKGRH